MNTDSARRQVNGSGFPFQLRVGHDVTVSCKRHLWRPYVGEHYWQHAQSGDEGFADLILEKSTGVLPDLYMIVECKRFSGGRWIFLTTSDQDKTRHAHVLEIRLENGDPYPPVWTRHECSPTSFESSFCVVPGQKEKHAASLERICSHLLNSVESIAVQQLELLSQQRDRWLAHIPAIVTNMELFVCQFDPSEVDVKTGGIQEEAGEFIPVSYVRFRKAFSTRFFTDKTPMNLKEMNRETQRTVFVVHAPDLPKFLAEWGLEE